MVSLEYSAGVECFPFFFFFFLLLTNGINPGHGQCLTHPLDLLLGILSAIESMTSLSLFSDCRGIVPRLLRFPILVIITRTPSFSHCLLLFSGLYYWNLLGGSITEEPIRTSGCGRNSPARES